MSSVGQAVGGIVGGVIGFFVGGPGGALYGAQVGMMVGGYIDPPPGPVINGPRLNDLSVQTSTYGAFIPRNYGTIAQHGNIFWLQGDALTETPKTTESGGKGGPTTTTNTWDYSATFAVGLCQGPIDGIRRIWIAGQLWYDAGSDDLATIIASNQKSGLFTLYRGTDTQTADPTMQADKGVANVPAYRGLAYIVFNNLPLENYGNSLMTAQVKCEIVKTGDTVIPSLVQAFDADGWYVNYAGDGIIQTAYQSTPILPGATVTATINFRDYEASSGRLIQQFTVSASLVPDGYSVISSLQVGGGFVIGQYGVVYVGTNVTGNKHVAFSTDLEVGEGLLVSDSMGFSNSSGNTEACFYAGGAHWFVKYGTTHITRIIGNSVAELALSHAFGEPCAVADDQVTGSTYIRYEKDGGLGSWLMDITGDLNPVAPLSDVYLGGGYTGQTAGFMVYDGRAVFAHTPIKVYDIASATNIQNQTVEASTLYSVSPAGDGVFYVNGNIYTISQFTGDTTTLGAIVQDECLGSGLLDAGDIDVTELTDVVRGYRVSSLGAIRGALDPLRAAWPFDVVQHGYQVKFKRRGSASVATIYASELDARAAGEAPGVQITDSREMDIMLPRRVSLSYVDSVREYDTNMQPAERINTDAVSDRAIELPIVLNADEAAQKADTLLYLYWLERYDIAFKLPPTYAHLEPGDVISITSDSASYEVRLTKTNTLPDGRIECAGKYNAAAIYTSTAVGEEGQSTGAALTLAGPSVYTLLDIPLMRDDDDTAGFPVAMAGYLDGWPGGILYRTDDAGETWTDVQAFAPGAVIGTALNTTAATRSTMYDLIQRLQVRLYSGTLSSVTEAQMFAGQNWFAYGIDGRWEIMAARLATLQGDGTYYLQDLIHGQYGTEWAGTLHQVGDLVVLLDTASLQFISVNSSSIGSARTYRGITLGQPLTSDADRSFTYNAVNLEPLSPINLTGDRDPPTSKWRLYWTRRTRFVEWRDYVDAQLGEATESYEVDVFSDATYTTVKRTLASATQTVDYSSAHQIADFGSNQATLYLKIYQLSATVGRGYPLTASITRT